MPTHGHLFFPKALPFGGPPTFFLQLSCDAFVPKKASAFLAGTTATLMALSTKERVQAMIAYFILRSVKGHFFIGLKSQDG
jgi:hypothetical protein